MKIETINNGRAAWLDRGRAALIAALLATWAAAVPAAVVTSTYTSLGADLWSVDFNVTSDRGMPAISE